MARTNSDAPKPPLRSSAQKPKNGASSPKRQEQAKSSSDAPEEWLIGDIDPNPFWEIDKRQLTGLALFQLIYCLGRDAKGAGRRGLEAWRKVRRRRSFWFLVGSGGATITTTVGAYLHLFETVLRMLPK